jgi:hypothetical protein
MKAVKAHLQEKNPERVPIFEKKAQEFAKKIVGNFKDYEFYVGESMNPEGMVALLVSGGFLGSNCPTPSSPSCPLPPLPRPAPFLCRAD